MDNTRPGPGTNYFGQLNNSVKISLTDEFNLGMEAECNGNPNVVATDSNIFNVGCKMTRKDILSGSNVYFNTGTSTSPNWTLAGGGNTILLEVNGTPNGSQTLLNLIQGSNITLTDNGAGDITIASTGGGTPGGLNLQVQYNNAGVFGGISGAVTNGTILNLTNPLIGGATITTSTVNGVTLVNGGTSTIYLSQDGNYTTPAGTYFLPTASTSVLGGVKVDGTSITISGGVISATSSGGGTVTSVASADGSITVTNPTSTVDLAVVKAPILSTARTIGGVSFNGSANITVATATGGFTVSGGDLVIGANNLTITGSIGSTGSRVLKGWFTDLQVTNAIAGSITGNAGTATALATSRTIGTLTGDATSAGSSFDGSANNTNALTLATVNSNVGSFGSATQTGIFTVNAKGLITAASNITITPAVGSITGLGTGISTFLVTPSSSNLASAVTDETGSGALVFANSPTLITAILGSSTATTQTPGDNSTKVATTAYVQAAIFATGIIAAVKYATASALPTATYNNGTSGVGATLTGVGLGAVTIDGVTPTVADRILVKNQSSTFQNGVYVITVVGTVGTAYVLTRSADYNQSTDIDLGDQVFVTAGNTLANTTWTQNGTEDPIMGTDPITFAQTAGPGSYTAGNGISITGVSIAIDTSITVDKTTVQTLTNKTIAAGSNTITGLTNTNLSGSAGITNANLANSAVTIGSTSVSLGATVTTFTGLVSVTSTTFVGALTGNAATVTTNANLTGVITSSGNATSIASQTGTGTKFVVDTAPTFVTSITTPSVLATSDDSGALGASGTAFSDLFLASGAVINFNAGNATITHSASLLTSNVNIAVPDDAYASIWNGSANVPTKNAVYDANFETENLEKIYQGLGSAIITQAAGVNLTMLGTNVCTLFSGTAKFIAIWIPRTVTVTGVKWFQTTAGAYTGDTSNVVALYTYSAGTLTRVAISSDDATIWKTTANTVGSKAFTGTYAASPGLYFIGMLYHSSAQTIAPILAGLPTFTASAMATADFTNSARLFPNLSSQTTLSSSFAMSTTIGSTTTPWAALY